MQWGLGSTSDLPPMASSIQGVSCSHIGTVHSMRKSGQRIPMRQHKSPSVRIISIPIS